MICTQMGMSEGKEMKIYCDILCVGADINVRLFGLDMRIRIKKLIKNLFPKKKEDLRHKFYRRIVPITNHAFNLNIIRKYDFRYKYFLGTKFDTVEVNEMK